MKILAFSDLHCDIKTAQNLVHKAKNVDVLVCAGDLSIIHKGLEKLIKIFSEVSIPTILVPGNNETTDNLTTACKDWKAATILHGSGIKINGIDFWGLGGGVPTTPWDWSYDLTESEASEMLEACPKNAILISHSPPKGFGDDAGGMSLGSEAVLNCIKEKQPKIVFCGHIHECWGKMYLVNGSTVYNCGPNGQIVNI